MKNPVFLSFVLWGIFRLLWLTCRIKVVESPEFKADLKGKKPIILAHWHGDELALLSTITTYKLCTMTSLSKDGELVTQLVRRLGGQSSRGSSSRGAVAALKGIIRQVKQGNVCSMAVDGPRGPIYKVKPGIFEIAKLSKATIYTLSVACTRYKTFEKSWNKAIFPKPFSTIYITVGENLLDISNYEGAKDPKASAELERQLTDAKQKVSKLIAQS